jgi:hypothetical protein
MDWTASGRLYRPIEEKLMNEFGPFVANTHRNYVSPANTTTQHTSINVNANSDDVITDGTGMMV